MLPSRSRALTFSRGTLLPRQRATPLSSSSDACLPARLPQRSVLGVDVVDLQPVPLGVVAALLPGPCQADAQDGFYARLEALLQAGDEVAAWCSLIPIVQPQVVDRHVYGRHQVVEDQ